MHTRSSRCSSLFSHSRLLVSGLALAAAACGGGDSTGPSSAPGFLAGTSDNHEIGIVVNSTGKALTLFQLGSPTTQRQVALGASSTITPTGTSVRGRRAAVPLGNAASVAVVDLENASIQRIFTFASGNATGSAFADDTTIVAANTALGIVGKFTVGQTADAITTTAPVAPQPTSVSVSAGRVLVVSSNLDSNFMPIGNGVVTILDAKTLQPISSVTTGGTNATDGAVGPDGLFYVLNTGDYTSPGSMTIVDPSAAKVVTTIADVGVGPGAISINANGLAYISGFSFGTLVWDTKTRTFQRGPANPVCAKLAGGGCRGAFAAARSAGGDLYQLFFGSASQNLAPYAFVYKGSAYTLSDSVSVGSGPAAIAIRTF